MAMWSPAPTQFQWMNGLQLDTPTRSRVFRMWCVNFFFFVINLEFGHFIILWTMLQLQSVCFTLYVDSTISYNSYCMIIGLNYDPHAATTENLVLEQNGRKNQYVQRGGNLTLECKSFSEGYTDGQQVVMHNFIRWYKVCISMCACTCTCMNKRWILQCVHSKINQ